MILSIKVGRRYMMAIIPVGVYKFTVIGVVHDDLLFGDLETTSVLVLAVSKLEDLASALAS